MYTTVHVCKDRGIEIDIEMGTCRSSRTSIENVGPLLLGFEVEQRCCGFRVWVPSAVSHTKIKDSFHRCPEGPRGTQTEHARDEPCHHARRRCPGSM